MAKKSVYFVFGSKADRSLDDALAVFDDPKKVEKFKTRFKTPDDYRVEEVSLTRKWFKDRKRNPYTLIFDVKRERQNALEELYICTSPHLIECARVGTVTNDKSCVYIRLMAKSKKSAVKKGYRKFGSVLDGKLLHKEVNFLDSRF